MSDRNLDEDYEALLEWAEARGLESHELLALCSATAGRVIAVHIGRGLDAEGTAALVRETQRALMRGAGIDPDASQDTKH